MQTNILKNLFSIILYMIVFITYSTCSKSESDQNISNTETEIVNLANDPYDEYIGRGIKYHTHMMTGDIEPGEEGWLGNPHPIGWCDICHEYHSRDECIAQFKKDFYNKINAEPGFKNSVLKLKGKCLGCYCKPQNCHGDVIKEWLDAQSLQ